MDKLIPASSRQNLEGWLRYYEDLNLGEFYTDRRKMGTRSKNPAIARASAVPLPSLAVPDGPSSPLSVVTVGPSVPVPSSLFDAASRIPGDTLELIRADLGECTRCRLHKGRNKIVFGAGNPRAQLVFVGEGPGHDEDIQGLPFVGRAGKLLTQMIEAMGLRREDVYIANVVKCRPPENRKPEEDEVATCSPYLYRQLDVIAPKAIVCLGAVAAQTLLKTTDPISRFRGTWFDYRGTKLLPTYHPAYLLRNPAAKGEVWKDLQKVMELLGLEIRKSNPPAEFADFKWFWTATGTVALTSAATLPLAMSAICCEVALSVPLRSTFTYEIPERLAGLVTAGCRVLVPFRNRAMTGVVVAASTCRPDPEKVKNLKEIIEVLDSIPALTPNLVELGRWVSGYYVAPPGEVLRAMLPPQVDLRHEREYVMTDLGLTRREELDSGGNRSENEVSELALLSLIRIGGKPVRADRLRKLPGGEAAAERLVRRGQLLVREVALHRHARTQKIVAWNTNTETANLIEKEERVYRVLAEERGPLPLPTLAKLSRVSRPLIERLIREEKLKSWEEPVVAEEDLFGVDYTPPSNILNPDQARALGEIRNWLEAGTFTVGLLYGVTGSGKTEVYMNAVEAALARNKTALMLVPEIALTLWIGRLCRARFGAEVAVLHSALGDVERAREWWRVRRGEARVVVGTRSAVFAPLENLGLVVVDEEQEGSYKQEETPRYHGRDVAIVRAKLEGAVALLGSATPSLESFHHARSGKYQLLQLETRVEGRPMAAVEIVDMREDFKTTHKAGVLSTRLNHSIGAHLEAGTQSLILINRRGYSWFVICRSCGVGIQCENCSISLTYHKQRDRLECHYCGFSGRVPKICPKCQSEHVYFFGAGAEQIEEKLRGQFPAAKIARLDRDAVRSKRAYQQVLADFAECRLDILVGTQMVAKGHDFQRVTLVGVVSVDSQLSLPDFRAAERTFQLIAQVAGRAGRGLLPGEVLVETYYPEHYAIQLAARQDYQSFYERELQFRRLLHYPPFTALACVLVRDTKIENAIRWSRQLSAFLASQQSLGVKVLGPAAAPLARLKREYRFQFLLKAPKRTQLTRIVSELLAFCEKKEIPERAVLVDVDPLSLF